MLPAKGAFAIIVLMSLGSHYLARIILHAMPLGLPPQLPASLRLGQNSRGGLGANKIRHETLKGAAYFDAVVSCSVYSRLGGGG
ncbi:hypothetical protein ACQKWADRAFT_297944 [Trichoderma austrokoningii]